MADCVDNMEDTMTACHAERSLVENSAAAFAAKGCWAGRDATRCARPFRSHSQMPPRTLLLRA